MIIEKVSYHKILEGFANMASLFYQQSSLDSQYQAYLLFSKQCDELADLLELIKHEDKIKRELFTGTSELVNTLNESSGFLKGYKDDQNYIKVDLKSKVFKREILKLLILSNLVQLKTYLKNIRFLRYIYKTRVASRSLVWLNARIKHFIFKTLSN